MKMKRKRSFKSFVRHYTLIEILAVCALLAFLMGLIVGAFSIATAKMAEADCRSTIEKIATALESYKAKTGYFIQSGSGTTFNIDTPSASEVDFTDFIDYETMKKKGAIVNNVLTDPWGTPFSYKCPGAHNTMTFDIESAGPDMDIAVTEDNLKNWE